MVDSCYSERTLSQAEDCLRPLTDLYFGKPFSRSCSAFALLIAEAQCKGCPWRAANLSDPDPIQWSPTLSSCSISTVAKQFGTEQAVRVQMFLPAAFATFVLSLIGVNRDVHNRVLVPRYLFGLHMPELLVMGLQWCIFTVGNVLMLFAETYASVCETPAANYGQHFARILVGTSFRVLSLYQCAFLDTERGKRQGSFLSEVRLGKKGKTTRYTLRILCLLLVIFLSGVYVFAMFASRLQEFKCSNLCRLGNRVTAFGICQYARVALELVSVMVFALGRRENRVFDVFRFAFLSCSVIASVGLMVPNFRIGVWNHTVDMLIPGVQDRFVSNWLETLSHLVILFLMAIAELARIPSDDVEADLFHEN